MIGIRLLSTGTSSAAYWPPGPFPAAAPFWRAYWAARDCATLSYGSRRVTLGPGVLIVIAPETDYRRRAPGALDHIHAHFSFDPPATVAPGIHHRPVDAALAAAIAEARSALAADRDGPEAQILALRFCTEALRAVPPQAWHRERRDPRVAAAQAALAQRLRDAPDNRALAARAGMHVNAFTRLFRQETGTTPQRYLAEQRVAEACHLLEHSGARMEAIAETVGCCDRYHLTRLFTRLRGVPPATWRRQVRGQGEQDGRSSPKSGL